MIKETFANMGAKFLDLLQQSIIVQGIITVLVVGAWIYMLIVGNPQAGELEKYVALVLGFYFGGKAVLQAQRLKGGG